MPVRKQETITFKVDQDLAELIKQLPNRSQFIRHAILNMMENTCPLCQGTGILNPSQKRHWNEFSREHELQKCEECNELYMVCRSGSGH